MGENRGKSSASHSGRIIGLVFIVFLVLKLTGVIDWSWWWVTSPLWLAALAVVAVLVIAGGLGYLIYRIVKSVRRKRSV
jgi:phosphoglycerol transferase MdoB-like AlkP superfamily enzyme